MNLGSKLTLHSHEEDLINSDNSLPSFIQVTSLTALSLSFSLRSRCQIHSAQFRGKDDGGASRAAIRRELRGEDMKRFFYGPRAPFRRLRGFVYKVGCLMIRYMSLAALFLGVIPLLHGESD